jgi:hypothetical protein
VRPRVGCIGGQKTNSAIREPVMPAARRTRVGWSSVVSQPNKCDESARAADTRNQKGASHDSQLSHPHRDRLAAILVAFTAGSALAMPPGYCTDYAGSAVREFYRAINNPSCPGVSGLRWHADYRLHYSWCPASPIRRPPRESGRRGELSYIRAASEADA